ncbi:MAG: UDP-N-acetylglucosamine 1-carboxyvinyltransferase [Candidatus Vogelbacteria bacterium RIFOXYD1_FULL_46_19]|uniref:UDP-N-acetylglucosamine 1-carboxyvinyltransferase n=1 Tax=Candidatus Vogelbacteria bacterium RIFOXYD1_FULL_46_19 TaxID=1802439 RepID=A0A1G2QG13_9BACT|nr:MAG: UDP-N-acetylglucosamine 1-carboxyvinyltransferase [Candidatus Vogelbacteria bacterium RIFOXYD1_FULL_46_19]
MFEEEKFVIKGLEGKRCLSGELKTPGAKNAVLKVLAAALLFKDEVNLANVPDIEDVSRMLELLEDLGVVVEKNSPGTYRLITTDINSSDISVEISKRLRASIVLTGPLLGRLGRAAFPHPGGCVIGKRPIDFTLEGFISLGASLTEETECYVITAPVDGLQGTEIFFKTQSVTSTENFMMAAVLARGKTILKNSALEPEVVSLGEFLNDCGARIEGLGTSTITIYGGELLSGQGKVYVTIPDRIAAGSFIVLAALTAEDVLVTDCRPDHLDALIYILRSMGVQLEVTDSSVRIRGRQPTFKAVDIKTHEYPGFPTDLQAPLAVLLTQSEGSSFIFETIFENRLQYLDSISRMGAEVKVIDAHRALLTGPSKLEGKEVASPDLRAGLAYVIAAIIASGESVVHNVYYIDRGYERLEESLQAIGVDIKRVQ